MSSKYIDFYKPSIDDRTFIYDCVNASGYIGSDASFGNIFLLREKYGTEIGKINNFLVRYYNGENSRKGYTFPLGSGNIEKALSSIADDALYRGRPLEFCLVTGEQKKCLIDFYGDNYVREKNAGDSDYIYSQDSLSNLTGKKYQKKRNHISKFNRTYSDYELIPITTSNISDALHIEQQWMNGSYDSSKVYEYNALLEALENIDKLNAVGAILYIYSKPVGMTFATKIGDNAYDIHFEKVLTDYANNGGYAMINKLFAETLGEVKWINREEDINIEGLRKAKMSYHPDIILKKDHITFL